MCLYIFFFQNQVKKMKNPENFARTLTKSISIRMNVNVLVLAWSRLDFYPFNLRDGSDLVGLHFLIYSKYRKRSRISQILFFCSMKIHITRNEKYPLNLNFLLKRCALSQFLNVRLIYCLYFQFFAKKYCLTSNIIQQILPKFC